MEILLRETNIKKINIKDIWTVAYKKGDYQTIHHHGKSMYTGILYYDIQNKMDGTYFHQYQTLSQQVPNYLCLK